MRSHPLVWAALMLAVGSAAQAADKPRYAPPLPGAVVTEDVVRRGPAILVPDCVEVSTRLLSCKPRELIFHGSLPEPMLQVVDGPPHRRVRPYPQLFERPYGPYGAY